MAPKRKRLFAQSLCMPFRMLTLALVLHGRGERLHLGNH